MEFRSRQLLCNTNLDRCFYDGLGFFFLVFFLLAQRKPAFKAGQLLERKAPNSTWFFSELKARLRLQF